MSTAKLTQVDRAVHEIRCGRAIEVDGANLIHPEYIDEKTFKKIRANAKLVITKHRADSISGKTFKKDVEINLKNISFDEMQTIVSGHKPTPKFKLAFKETAIKQAHAAFEISRIAQLLPSGIIFAADKTAVKCSSKDILHYNREINETLELVADAPLTLHDAKKASIKAFRARNGAAEHMAILIGNPGKEPLVRIHSSCYTGDLLGSLTCDCGDQLKGAIKLMNEKGGGIILYLMQEGRGIGLVNKLHAYKLQANGLDTVEANEFLGFDDEERCYGGAVAMLRKLGIKKLKLVTNNPKKIKMLEARGIKVTGRVPMIIKHEHNKHYLEIKSSKSGHLLG